MRRFAQPLFAVVSLGVTDDCDEDAKATRRFFTGASLFLGMVSPIWGAMYIVYGEVGPGRPSR